ncbi:MAG: TonB-dependent receptor, partial [Candidatus Marinimicrobia bacterium]|nr:TonB-dependent receptor [Candidatus Neomarinimicrobiota bacterium]MCF7840967.1 TonB-dependent receptor [Candidatus Neomarinimicrobiota bacterium]
MRRFVVLGLLFLLGSNLTFAATVGTIAGTVVDDNTGEPLPGVNIVVEGLGLGTSSDIEGDYFIENVPVGRYTLKATMIGYDALTYEDVRVIMDQTTRINFRMQEGFVQGKEVVITAERPMVEKDVTVKKIVRSAEEIQNLPVRDLTEMLTLQSGVIQIKSAEYGIPGFEDRGIEQIHVRGGRSGEIGYTIDGMYIENPIYGGIGKGTRLNKYAVEELEVQTGVFSAEYGDAMSSIVNNISFTGGAEYEVKLTVEGSGVSPQKNDQLRDYQKIAGRLSGPILPHLGDKFTFSISGDITTGAYRTLKFDDKVYDPNDVGGVNNQANKVNWLDRYDGWRSFGFDNTSDIFTKLHWRIDNYKQVNFTYWYVNSEFKTFDRFYQFYEEGKNINRKWSERYNVEFRHQLNE